MAASQLRQRKEYRMLTDAERNAYHRAINDLKEDTSVYPNKYDALANHHANTGSTAHRGIGFVGWHRYYLVLYELALQEKNPNVMLPYWDSTLDSAMDTPTDTVIFTDKFLGNANGEGPFENWTRKIERSVGDDRTTYLSSNQDVENLIYNSRNQREFVRALETFHNSPHRWIGGNMLDVARAPFDPIFYMHHAFIDCIWERYREREKQNNQNPERYPSASSDNRAHQSSTLMENLPLYNNVRLTNADGYKNFWTEIYYTCAPSPSCSFNTPNCGSDWLKCDIFREDDVFEVHNRQGPTSPGFINSVPLPPSSPLSFRSGFNGQSGSTGLSDRKITAEEFFSALKTLKKESISIANTPRFNGISGRSGPPSRSNTHPLPQRTPSIDQLEIPKFQKACGGNPKQNTFKLDCKVGTDLWVFIPVKVVNLRHGDIIYSSFPVNLAGSKLNNTDVFSIGQPLTFASNLQSKARSKNKPCNYDKSGLFKVKVSSYGLNYNGIYEDTSFLNNRRTVSTEISYLAVDECGIACQPMVLMKGRQKRQLLRYRKTHGVIEITSKGPKYYSNTYRGAESLVWKADKFSVPQPDEKQIPIVFVCDYRSKNPWS
ncbi:unnamed protein product [Mytilus edulis]|uniref:Tyrosinase copper-binding domain-containing protein n=1 Tax=Mytilus edulis TaxID=6550 RepID=A0A8S3PWU5_MYTED|nr:unnamed protein product [Mytilus edulis]